MYNRSNLEVIRADADRYIKQVYKHGFIKAIPKNNNDRQQEALAFYYAKESSVAALKVKWTPPHEHDFFLGECLHQNRITEAHVKSVPKKHQDPINSSAYIACSLDYKLGRAFAYFRGIYKSGRFFEPWVNKALYKCWYLFAVDRITLVAQDRKFKRLDPHTSQQLAHHYKTVADAPTDGYKLASRMIAATIIQKHWRGYHERLQEQTRAAIEAAKRDEEHLLDLEQHNLNIRERALVGTDSELFGLRIPQHHKLREEELFPL